jgi:hypothetical protein
LVETKNFQGGQELVSCFCDVTSFIAKEKQFTEKSQEHPLTNAKVSWQAHEQDKPVQNWTSLSGRNKAQDKEQLTEGSLRHRKSRKKSKDKLK